MSEYFLQLRLISDTTFGRGDGVSGLVDAEVEHDTLGLPFLRGRALKGLLAEECANILHAFERQGQQMDEWRKAADLLFGQPGSTLSDDGAMRVGDAQIPEKVRQAVKAAIDYQQREHEPEKAVLASEVLDAMTAIRRQTAIEVDGTPKKGSLRSARVVLRETIFESSLSFDFDPSATASHRELALLAACVASLRRVGSGRNRGRGRVAASLVSRANAAETDLTPEGLKKFDELNKEAL